jgi:hypothetical protein
MLSISGVAEMICFAGVYFFKMPESIVAGNPVSSNSTTIGLLFLFHGVT